MWHFSILLMVFAFCTYILYFLHNFSNILIQIFIWISHYITIFIVFYMHSHYVKLSQELHLFLPPLKSSLHYCCLQGQLCGLCLWFWPKQKMRMILRIKITLQTWRSKNDAAKMASQCCMETAVVLCTNPLISLCKNPFRQPVLVGLDVMFCFFESN